MIKLNENFTIYPDNQNFTLQFECEKEVSKNGDKKVVTSKETWYCIDLQSALRRFLTESLRPSTSVENVLTRINEVENIIKNVRL